MQGFDIGSHIDFKNFGLTLSFIDSKGIGVDGLYGGTIKDADIDATHWYVETDYQLDKKNYRC